MSQTLKELAEEDNSPAETVETVEEKPTEVPAPVVDDKPAEDPVDEDKDKDKHEETQTADDKPAEDGDKPKPPKDTSQFTKEEKAEFAFRRQLAKKDERHRQEIQEIRDSFQKQFDEFKASLTKKEPEPAKVRTDFEDDDSYIKYLVKQGMDEERAVLKAEQEQADKERQQREAQEAEYNQRQQMVLDAFSANCKEVIADEDFDEFSAKVQLASSNGLAELLNKAPAVRNYIFTCKRGPKLLYAMLKDRDTFANVMRTAATAIDPTMATIELDDMARAIPDKKAAPSPAPEPEPEQRTMPHLGKPGSGGAKGDVKDITNDDAELIKFMRSRR